MPEQPRNLSDEEILGIKLRSPTMPNIELSGSYVLVYLKCTFNHTRTSPVMGGITTFTSKRGTGVIIKLGTTCWDFWQKGDVVEFAMDDSAQIEHEGDFYLVIRQDDLLGKIEAST